MTRRQLINGVANELDIKPQYYRDIEFERLIYLGRGLRIMKYQYQLERIADEIKKIVEENRKFRHGT